MALTRLVPMLHVSDIRRSLAFYRDQLGFTLLSPEDLLATSARTTSGLFTAISGATAWTWASSA
jgi:catechol 2,3-dioxygenase-like lactoylglutathione lyase family enzyme